MRVDLSLLNKWKEPDSSMFCCVAAGVTRVEVHSLINYSISGAMGA